MHVLYWVDRKYTYSVPVSYTHLDVYKRQLLYGSETWATVKKHRSMIQASRVRFF